VLIPVENQCAESVLRTNSAQRTANALFAVAVCSNAEQVRAEKTAEHVLQATAAMDSAFHLQAPAARKRKQQDALIRLLPNVSANRIPTAAMSSGTRVALPR
jgi:hypothetical protein